MRRLILLLGIGLMALGVISCGSKKKQAPPATVVVQDLKPIGEAMKIGSYSALGVAVIIAIALMSRGKNN